MKRFIKVSKKICKVSFGKLPKAAESLALTGKGVHRWHEKRGNEGEFPSSMSHVPNYGKVIVTHSFYHNQLFFFLFFSLTIAWFYIFPQSVWFLLMNRLLFHVTYLSIFANLFILTQTVAKAIAYLSAQKLSKHSFNFVN